MSPERQKLETSFEGIAEGPGSCFRFRLALLWFRRDLRVTDNPALVASLRAAEKVVPVYIWAPDEEGEFSPGRGSSWWLHHSLGALEKDLRALGSRLVYRTAPQSGVALTELILETGADCIFFNELYDPISLARDNDVRRSIGAAPATCCSFVGNVLFEPRETGSEGSCAYTTFEDFYKRMFSLETPTSPPLPVPQQLPAVDKSIRSEGRHSLSLTSAAEEDANTQIFSTWTPGGQGAFQALQKVVAACRHRRGAVAANQAFSKLSPHMHFGELSARFLFHVVRQCCQCNEGSIGCEGLLQKIGLREYSRYLSFHKRLPLGHLQAIDPPSHHRLYKAWRQGTTGYPMVDASMRQLWSKGWLCSRNRIICASFLVKDLLLPWQWGLKHFWDCLVDADLEVDALGWLACSGRLKDPALLELATDQHTAASHGFSDGAFIRQWLPMLARLPTKWILRPWEAPERVLLDAGVDLGVNYPGPICSTPTQSRPWLQQTTTGRGGERSANVGPARSPSNPVNLNRRQDVNSSSLDGDASAALQLELGTGQSEVCTCGSGDMMEAESPMKRRRAPANSGHEEVQSNVVAPTDSSTCSVQMPQMLAA